MGLLCDDFAGCVLNFFVRVVVSLMVVLMVVANRCVVLFPLASFVVVVKKNREENVIAT